jgi:hypothetical protein
MSKKQDTPDPRNKEIFCKAEMFPLQVPVNQFSWTVKEDGIYKHIPLVQNDSLALNSVRKFAFPLTTDSSVMASCSPNLFHFVSKVSPFLYEF